jgi:hypothetical protein
MAWTELFNNDAPKGNTNEKDPIQKWHTNGQTVEGIFRGKRAGKSNYKPLLLIETETGMVTYTNATVLDKKLTAVKPGDRIKIVYLGKVNGANGYYGNFQVFIDAAPAPDASQPDYDVQEFQRLVLDIQAAKGAVVAGALEAIAKATGDPVKSLQDAMGQMGIEVVPF